MKITFVGGGSLVSGTDLLTDMALNAPLLDEILGATKACLPQFH
jgi:alpha-galactosidase/6-phospho-beta-glucosidase family protein